MIVYDPYATIPFADLVPDLVYDASGLPNDAAVHFLRRSAIQLARSSNAIVRRVCIHVQPGVEEYKLLTPGCHEEVVAILSVRGHGPCATEILRLRGRPVDTGCSFCAPAVSWFEEPDSIFIRTASTGRADVQVEFSTAPTPEACELDETFSRKFRETLLAGAKSMVFALADKPWTSRERAREYAMQYALGASDAAAETMMGGQRGAFRSFRTPVVM